MEAAVKDQGAGSWLAFLPRPAWPAAGPRGWEVRAVTRHGAGAGQPEKSSAQIPAEAVERGSGAVSLLNVAIPIPWFFLFYFFYFLIFSFSTLPVHLGPSLPKTRVSAVRIPLIACSDKFRITSSSLGPLKVAKGGLQSNRSLRL